MTSMSQTEQVHQIDPRLLKPHPNNPRGEIDHADPDIVQLSGSIAANGVIQPIVATPEHIILAGHRRTFAAIMAGAVTVPVVYRLLAAGELPEDIFLSENGHRQNLSALEEARAIAALRKALAKKHKKDIPITDLVRRLNMSASTVRERLFILDMPERVQRLYHIGEIPIHSSRQLARLLQWPEEIEKFADRMVTRHITMNSLDALVTRRIAELTKEADNKAILAREPKLQRIVRHHPENHHTPSLTRAVVAENLAKAKGKISLFNVRAVFDATCCSCGMVDSSVCLSCPLPKFVNGLIGRSDND